MGVWALVAEPAGLLPAREQMALSLGWHIILAAFGVAFPAMIFVVHRHGIRGDETALRLAKRWSKVAAVLFAIGAVSGTVLSFEMGLLWPGLMGGFGDVLGLPFAFEGLSFFTEAIFLGIYLYGWDRLPPRWHLAALVPMMAAGVFGTYCVIAVNTWMNMPTGFTLTGDGEVTDVQPWHVLFNSRALLQFAHMWLGAYMLVGFVVAAVYATGILRGRRDDLHRIGLMVPFGFASVAAILQPIVGHVLGMALGTIQPAKLAAFELDVTTENPAPLHIGGILVDGEPRWYLSIPRWGSFIARGSFHKPVRGLESFPADELPPVNTTHLAFQGMIGIGTALALAVVVYWFARWRGRDLLAHRWALCGMVLAGPLAVLALECGWVATEVGRQPWTVYGILRTVDAAGDNPGLWWVFSGVAVVYLGMTIGAVVVIRSMTRRWRAGEEDLPSPYGPAPEEVAR
ncbi:cytochrome bd-I ubiquinol oxidase subunit 1 apoprotein [Nocardioides terrae]|uniref:Cytochrome bd-I ubiquinol oxidase subunit 1 apoprotein n=1 Tax=Nocardioides terrae TaxID=574651 RepID=A0A1I1KXP8_9ACTN|nr:cytochrome ubiquinol oxidase subunit I [Nocardioides terrae]SFC65596.1 cytochrome bd-I ubiquinol oxidase subunit 1 apoprotein [Nocardioides terrae]